MAWARIDDGFDDHPKILALLEEDQGATAVGLWTLCLTWAHRNTRRKGKTPGLIPVGLPRRYLGPAGREIVKLLVAHELWDEVDGGWMIHDFADYLPTEETKAARSEAGKRGAAKRWADKHKAEAESAEAGAKQTDGNLPPDDGNDMASDGSRAPARRAIPYGIAPTPEPVPSEEPSVPHETSDGDAADDPADDPDDSAEETRDDVERVCKHLADRVQANGSKRPRIGKTWRREARLLMDTDGRTEEQVHRAIEWSQSNSFWKRTVMSMPTLRKQYDRMRLQAEEERERGSPGLRNGDGPARSTTDERVAQAQALKATFQNRDPSAEQENPSNAIPGVVVR